MESVNDSQSGGQGSRQALSLDPQLLGPFDRPVAEDDPLSDPGLLKMSDAAFVDAAGSSELGQVDDESVRKGDEGDQDIVMKDVRPCAGTSYNTETPPDGTGMQYVGVNDVPDHQSTIFPPDVDGAATVELYSHASDAPSSPLTPLPVSRGVSPSTDDVADTRSFVDGREGLEFPTGTPKVTWPQGVQTFLPFISASVKKQSYSVSVGLRLILQYA